VEPADFEGCLSCYAYKVLQDREASNHTPADAMGQVKASRRADTTIEAVRDEIKRRIAIHAAERDKASSSNLAVIAQARVNVLQNLLYWIDGTSSNDVVRDLEGRP
jgi:hypothetical protein